ncbi:hypothetical protein FGO68_gene11083 [Halteria grandinella]|uniref:Uncharacterized protein n=1 Tax=Halteria grandinella TaxID=5974 RepID=A0A8J8SXG7_HALGN|nr:hypothetical protein FGO68_gene11083 [Halteria grandinella]
MVEQVEPRVDENGVPEVRTQDILKEGYLLKQSRYIKDWRKKTNLSTLQEMVRPHQDPHPEFQRRESLQESYRSHPDEPVPDCQVGRGRDKQAVFLQAGSERTHLLYAGRELWRERGLDRSPWQGNDQAVGDDR